MLGTRITELKASLAILQKAVEDNTAAERENGERLKELLSEIKRLSRANEDFVHVIEHFFAIRKKLDIEEAKRREKREIDHSPTEYDLRY